MLTSLCLLFALSAAPGAGPSPKAVSQVEVLGADLVLVVYTDTSMAVAPFKAFNERGELKAGYPSTEIAAITSDELVTRWTDTRGLAREVRTNCATLKQVDCVIQHNKMVDLLLAAAPAPKPIDK